MLLREGGVIVWKSYSHPTDTICSVFRWNFKKFSHLNHLVFIIHRFQIALTLLLVLVLVQSREYILKLKLLTVCRRLIVLSSNLHGDDFMFENESVIQIISMHLFNYVWINVVFKPAPNEEEIFKKGEFLNTSKSTSQTIRYYILILV